MGGLQTETPFAQSDILTNRFVNLLSVVCKFVLVQGGSPSSV